MRAPKVVMLITLPVAWFLVGAAHNNTAPSFPKLQNSTVTSNKAQQRAHKNVTSSDNNKQTTSGNLTISARNLDDLSHRLDEPVQPVEQALDTRAPFWNIAHMINSLEQVELALRAGSNGIETDVSFDATSGRPVEAYHGFPCDCGRHCHHREDFVKFVRHLARLTTPPASSSRLLLVLFDLKLKELKSTSQKEAAGFQLAQIIHKNLYQPYELAVRSHHRHDNPLELEPPLRVILSINHAADLPLVRSFIDYMRQHKLHFMSQQVGFDVGMNDELRDISAAWDQLQGSTVNIWQGDGLTNCANIVRGVERLKQALAIRNAQGHFRKVYYWTVDVMYHIRSVLRLGLDAVLTNQPQRVVQVLEEPEFRGKFRMATPWDNPFEQFAIRPSGAGKLAVPSVSEALETAVNVHKTGTNFIKTLPDGISAALRKVHQTIG